MQEIQPILKVDLRTVFNETNLNVVIAGVVCQVVIAVTMTQRKAANFLPARSSKCTGSLLRRFSRIHCLLIL